MNGGREREGRKENGCETLYGHEMVSNILTREERK